MVVEEATVSSAALIFRKATSMRPKRKLVKSTQKPVPKPPPIVIVPDTSYLDDKGNIFLQDIIIVSDATVYTKIRMSLTDMAKRKTDGKSK